MLHRSASHVKLTVFAQPGEGLKPVTGQVALETLMNEHPGEIKAQIVEENGQVVMRKTCPKHGEFVDVMATDPAFLERIESLFFGRDFRAAEDSHVHHHGTSNIKFGRGAVLTVDLTNRCNMMCNPCFMDANQVGYVHEPTYEDTKAILDRAVSFKPKRQIIILFSGGEPTLSPYYLEAVAYAKKVGFYRILAATNGIRFAEDIEFCKAAKAAIARCTCSSTAWAKKRTSIAASAICST